MGLAERWFTERGWEAFPFQREAWDAYLRGESGLIHAPTGIGKTLAAWFGPLMESAAAGPALRKARRRADAEPLRVLWITPLRALASDTVASLLEPVRDLGLPWTVEERSGDTTSARRAHQRGRLPTALVTTPESLSVLLSYPDSRALLGTVHAVVVDEWHELMGSKRGVQTELGLARLRRWSPGLRTWGLSATMGNVDEAARTLVGPGFPPERLRIIRGREPKGIEIETILPEDATRFPWSGHLGLALLPQVVERIEAAGTTLLFTNTRSQAELWFRGLLGARPDWLGKIGLHHGSLDRGIRDRVEGHLKGTAGTLRCVVCTSSLDLGVDFAPVDQVIQVGSPKGAGRLLQRAGRSGHRPGAVSRVVCVPTHAFELVEFSAARAALRAGKVEDRPALSRTYDVLAQHLVTVAAGGGFEEEELREEVRSTAAFCDLGDAEWRWAMDFVSRGGPTLTAYPRFSRVAPGEGGRHAVPEPLARRHRMTIGTIAGDAAIRVQYVGGRSLGTMEESFIARLHPGERFTFAGRVLELVDVRGMTALVRRASGRGTVPQWSGGKMPLSSRLCEEVMARMDEARRGELADAEMEAVRALLALQERWSVIPGPDELLVEHCATAEGHHSFVYPFAGRLAHEGLGALLAHRYTRGTTATVTVTSTDYGIELLAHEPVPADEGLWRTLLSPRGLADDLNEALNTTQMARRQFRGIARVAGLIAHGYPGERQPARHLQASSDMFYEVFSEFDPANLLLDQARREMLEGQVEIRRLGETLEGLERRRLVFRDIEQLTPFAFPLWAETMRAVHASSEAWTTRVRRMAMRLERAADSRSRRPATAGAAR